MAAAAAAAAVVVVVVVVTITYDAIINGGFVSFKRRLFLSPGKEPLMLVVSVTRWIPGPVYTLWRIRNLCLC